MDPNETSRQPIHEPKSEILNPNRLGLYGRLLLASQPSADLDRVLNPAVTDLNVPPISPDRNWTPPTEKLSIEERTAAWQGYTYKDAMEKWTTDFTDAMHSETGVRFLTDIGFFAEETGEFNRETAEYIYDRYCKGGSKTDLFIKDLTGAGGNPEDREWFLRKLFGPHTAEAISRIFELEAEISHNPNAVANLFADPTRINNLNLDEKTLLTYLHGGLGARPVAEPAAQPVEAAAQTTPAAETTDERIHKIEAAIEAVERNEQPIDPISGLPFVALAPDLAKRYFKKLLDEAMAQKSAAPEASAAEPAVEPATAELPFSQWPKNKRIRALERAIMDIRNFGTATDPETGKPIALGISQDHVENLLNRRILAIKAEGATQPAEPGATTPKIEVPKVDGVKIRYKTSVYEVKWINDSSPEGGHFIFTDTKTGAISATKYSEKDLEYFQDGGWTLDLSGITPPTGTPTTKEQTLPTAEPGPAAPESTATPEPVTTTKPFAEMHTAAKVQTYWRAIQDVKAGKIATDPETGQIIDLPYEDALDYFEQGFNKYWEELEKEREARVGPTDDDLVAPVAPTEPAQPTAESNPANPRFRFPTILKNGELIDWTRVDTSTFGGQPSVAAEPKITQAQAPAPEPTASASGDELPAGTFGSEDNPTPSETGPFLLNRIQVAHPGIQRLPIEPRAEGETSMDTLDSNVSVTPEATGVIKLEATEQDFAKELNANLLNQAGPDAIFSVPIETVRKYLASFATGKITNKGTITPTEDGKGIVIKDLTIDEGWKGMQIITVFITNAGKGIRAEIPKRGAYGNWLEYKRVSQQVFNLDSAFRKSVEALIKAYHPTSKTGGTSRRINDWLITSQDPAWKINNVAIEEGGERITLGFHKKMGPD